MYYLFLYRNVSITICFYIENIHMIYLAFLRGGQWKSRQDKKKHLIIPADRYTLSVLKFNTLPSIMQHTSQHCSKQDNIHDAIQWKEYNLDKLTVTLKSRDTSCYIYIHFKRNITGLL